MMEFFSYSGYVTQFFLKVESEDLCKGGIAMTPPIEFNHILQIYPMF